MQKTKLQRCGKTLLTYTAVLALMAVVGCALLYVTGLDLPSGALQERIDFNIGRSAQTFENEGVYPNAFSQHDPATMLDNYTESLILATSKYSNTLRDPLSIFKNPRYKGEVDNIVADFTAVADGAEPNEEYSRYWMGFRAFVRPLLAALDYEQIRVLLRYVVIALFALTAVSIYRHAGANVAVAFVLSMALFEMGVVSTLIQYSTCFVLAMLGMVALPHMRKKKSRVMLFFIIGGLTQYFDFYTVPSVTLGLPLVYLMLVPTAQGDEKPNAGLMLLQCMLAWLAAYAGMAALRAALVSVFLGRNEFAVILQSFTKWTGIQNVELYSKFTAITALKSVFETVLTKGHLVALIGIGVCFIVTLVLKWRRNKRLGHPAYLCLLCALIPIVWTCVASKATQNHVFFQYRLLATFVFAVFCFFASLLGNTKKQTLESTLPEMSQTDE